MSLSVFGVGRAAGGAGRDFNSTINQASSSSSLGVTRTDRVHSDSRSHGSNQPNGVALSVRSLVFPSPPPVSNHSLHEHNKKQERHQTDHNKNRTQ